MIKNKESLTLNAYKYLVADFLWNLGRTLPHAILTIYLLENGVTLSQIAVIQSIFMIVALISEFPSGVIADRFSRKNIYLASLILIFISYTLIGMYASNFWALCIAYFLYGLSMAFKSGTLEAEVVLELRREDKDVKNFSIATTQVMSISSLLGGFIGSIFYANINRGVYIIALIMFLLSGSIGYLCTFKKSEVFEEEKETIVNELKQGIFLLKSKAELRVPIIMFCLTAFFLQPFYQYWQVLYKKINIPVAYFGVIYVVFQICNVIAVCIYKRLAEKAFIFNMILVAIPFCFGIGVWEKKIIPIIFPIVIILFYIYNQHLDVVQKRVSPDRYISSYYSLIGTVENISSVISLLFMATVIEQVGIIYGYMFMFIVFTVLSLSCSIQYNEKLYKYSKTK